MKRKLLFAERMLHGDGNAPFNMVLPVKISGHFTSSNLTTALKKLQEKHPLLSAHIDYDSNAMPWFVTNDREYQIPVRVCKRVNDDDWQIASVHEWATPFDTRTGPLMRLVWIQGNELSELLLVFHHCCCDGEGALSLLSEMLLLLDNEEADIGKRYPLLAIESIIPPAIVNSRKKILKAKLMGKIASLVIGLIPAKKKSIDRGTDYLIHWKLTKELSDQLIIKCKSTQTTVNTALCVAVLNAFKAVRKEQFHNKISCPVDIRNYVPKIQKDHIFSFGLLIVASIGKSSDFFSEAKRMQLTIKKKLEKLDPYETMMAMEEAHPSFNKLMNLLKNTKPSNDCMFSNLGKINIPPTYRSFTVETIISPSVIGPLGNTITLLTSTYNGLMDFTFVGSEKYLPHKEALAIKDSLIAILSAQV